MSQTLSEKINQVIADYELPLVKYVAGILKDPEQARDVVQDALIRFIKELEKENSLIKNERAWLYRVCHNLALDYLRKMKKRSSLEGFLPVFEDDSVKSPEAELSMKEQKELVLDSLKELNEREQKIINMKVREHKSYKDIAEALGLSVNNVGFILHRSMKKLAVIFKQKDNGEVVR
jgi:RNA polymerase sigma factor (sigma-70 family)